MKIFREKNATAGLFGGANDQRIPKGKRVETVKIDGCQNICNLGNDYIKLRKDLDLPPCESRIDIQFSRDSDEIFLQHLERDNASSVAPVLRDQIDRAASFCTPAFVVCIDENISVKEATSVHGSRRD